MSSADRPKPLLSLLVRHPDHVLDDIQRGVSTHILSSFHTSSPWRKFVISTLGGILVVSTTCLVIHLPVGVKGICAHILIAHHLS